MTASSSAARWCIIAGIELVAVATVVVGLRVLGVTLKDRAPADIVIPLVFILAMLVAVGRAWWQILDQACRDE